MYGPLNLEIVTWSSWHRSGPRAPTPHLHSGAEEAGSPQAPSLSAATPQTRTLVRLASAPQEVSRLLTAWLPRSAPWPFGSLSNRCKDILREGAEPDLNATLTV